MATTNNTSPKGCVDLGGSATVSYTAGSAAASAASDVTFEWDFDNDGDFSESVEDITSYVMSAQTVTGRDFPSSLVGKASPGKLRLALNNDDDRFSYFNTSSPLNTSPFTLSNGRKIRVRTTTQSLGAPSGGIATYVGAGAASTGDNVSLTPALPSGLANGDLLLLWATIENSGTGTVDTPDGWLPLVTSGNVSLFGRYYSDGDYKYNGVTHEVVNAPTVSFTGGVAGATTTAIIAAWRDTEKELGAVLDTSIAQLNASAQNISVPGLVASTDNVGMMVFGWKQDTWTSVATLSGQLFTETSDTAVATGSSFDLQYRQGGFTNAKTFTATSLVVTGGSAQISRSVVIAIAPGQNIGDPILLASDRFDRSITSSLGKDDLGNTWTVGANGGFGISPAGTAQALDSRRTTYYNADILEVVETNATDHYVQAKVTMLVQDGRVGLIARYIDSSNYVRMYYSAADRAFLIQEVKAGSATTKVTWYIEPWEDMTIGLQVTGPIVTGYVGGNLLSVTTEDHLTAAATGTKAGLYGRWQSHSDVPPALDDFQVWDRLAQEIDGVIWTGTVKSTRTVVHAGDLKIVEVEAESALAAAAVAEVAAPRITRTLGEHRTGNHSVPAGCIVGDIMARAGLQKPPHPLPCTDTSDLGPHAVGDGKALEMARAVEGAERGFLRETNEGGVTFEDRYYRDTVSSAAWFTDTVGTGQYGYTDIEPLNQQTQIVNRAIAGVAASAPTVVDVANQSGSHATALNVTFTVPTVIKGDLLLLFLVCSAGAAGEEFGAPPPWTDHRRLRQQEGNGVRVYSLICDGTESGDTVYFYKGSSEGTFIIHYYHIRNWYGSDDGIKIARFSQGTDAYPLSPGWNRAPSLFVTFQGVIGSTGGVVWGPLDTPPPVGYNYDSLEGLVVVYTPKQYETGVESVYKIDVTDTENPRAWENVFDDYLLLETVVVAVRGYDGPLKKATIDEPKASSGEGGEYVYIDDTDSQNEHNFIRVNNPVPKLAYTRGDAEDWCNDVLDTYSEDRPIITLSFVASKTTALRSQAIKRRVSDKVTVTATGNAGLGISGQFFIEAVHHEWSHGNRLWRTTWELSPA